MPNLDNAYGTYNKITHVLTQVDDGSVGIQNFADVNTAKSWFYTADALTVFDECCTELQWSVVDNQKLKYTATFGVRGTDYSADDDWASQFNSRKTALIAAPKKSASISNAVQKDIDETNGSWKVTITAAGHNFVAGDLVKVSGVSGMTQLNVDAMPVDSVDGNNFDLLFSNNSSVINFSAYTSGGTAESRYQNKWGNNPYTTVESEDHLF